MSRDYSISQEDIDRQLQNNKKIILKDMEIISHLRNEITKDTTGYKVQGCKIILVSIDGVPHIISSDTPRFLMYHVVIASAFSLTNEKCEMKICGGGHLIIEKHPMSEDIIVKGNSSTFKEMNPVELEKIFSILALDVEIDETEMDRNAEYRVYSYDRLNCISQHII